MPTAPVVVGSSGLSGDRLVRGRRRLGHPTPRCDQPTYSWQGAGRHRRPNLAARLDDMPLASLADQHTTLLHDATCHTTGMRTIVVVVV
jgi:hypothetical protein